MKLFYNEMSIPCRAVMLLLHTIKIEPELVHIDLMTGEHKTPEFIEINMQHTVPVLDDDGFILTESRAILAYLGTKYGSGTDLVPTDPQKRAIVDQRLYFDMGTITELAADTYYYPLTRGEGKINEDAFEKLTEALGWLDKFIGESSYVAGDSLTVADFALVSSISAFEAAGLDVSTHPRIVSWRKHLEAELPGYVETNNAAELFGKMIKSLMTE